MADARFSLSAQGHFRPSFAFSSNWSSSGSEGHGRGSFFGRQKEVAAAITAVSEQREVLQLRRQTLQSSNEQASQQSPHSFRGPAASFMQGN